MNRPGMDAVRALLLCMILGAAGCAGLSAPAQPVRQDKAPPVAANDGTPADATTSAAGDAVSEDKRLENLAAVREFLERTQDLPPPTQRRAATADAVARTIDPPPTGAQAPPTAAAPRALANAHVELAPSPPPRPLPVIQSVAIRTREAAPAGAPKPIAEKVTNAPLDLERSSQIHAIDTVYTDWKAQADGTSDFETQWRITMLQLALGRDAEAAGVSANLAPGARQVLGAFVSAAVAARSAARNPLLVDDNQLTPADDLRRALAELADPVVAHVAFCKRVVTFGVYDEMPATDFVAGRATQTILYCEIRNFASEKIDDDRFRTRLGTRLELLSADGRSAWQQTEPDIEDVARTRRTDFFLAQRITLPANLPAGQYTMKVYVEDKLSAKANEATHALTIMEQAAVALNVETSKRRNVETRE